MTEPYNFMDDETDETNRVKDIREDVAERDYQDEIPASQKCIADIMAPWVYLCESDHDAHWYRYVPGHENWASITVDQKNWGEWWVEVYPSPYRDDGGESRFALDTRDEVAQKVADLMEEV